MNKKVCLFSIIIIILLCIVFCRSPLNSSNDTFYLIKLGESIFKNGIDMLDHFSWIPNLTYTYPHWLYSIFLYIVYHNFSFLGLYIENMICFIALALSIYYVNLKLNKNNILALFTTIISIFSMNAFIVPRAQSMSIIAIFLSIYFINQLINTGKIKYSIYLALCSLIIANIHATIWIGFFVFFLPFFAEHLVFLLNKKRKKKKFLFNNRLSVEKVNNVKMLFVTFLICVVMGLFTPTRICYTYFFKTLEGNSQTFISEHLPLVIIRYPIVFVIWFLLFFIQSKTKLREFLMISGIILMTFISSRHLLFFFTIGLLYCSFILKRDMDLNKERTFDILEKRIIKNKLFNIMTIFLLILLCYFQIDKNIKDGFINKNNYPVLAVDYIKENLDYENIRIINLYNDGSYLLFNNIKVFIDSRCDLYLKEFNSNVEVFDDYIKYRSADNDFYYDFLIEKYDAEYILLRKNNFNYFALKMDNRYRELYSDYTYALYKKI